MNNINENNSAINNETISFIENKKIMKNEFSLINLNILNKI